MTKENMILALKNNALILIFWIISLLIEFTSVLLTSGKFYIQSPEIFLTILTLFSIILFLVRSQVARTFVATTFLLLQGVLNIGFVLLFDLTGQIFDYSMLGLRNDAWAAIQSVPLNFTICFVFGISFSAFIIFGYRFAKYSTALPKISRPFIKGSLLVVLSTLLLFTSVKSTVNTQNKYEKMLYSNSDNSYNNLGILGNMISTLILGSKEEKPELGYTRELSSFLFNKNAIYASNFPENRAKNYNVVTVLCESFEWMSIVENKEAFPNGLDLVIPPQYANSNKSAAELLFPNLYGFMKESTVFSNYHSKEKTDISENYTHFGAYPLGALTNYDFDKNAYPQSLTNTLKLFDEPIQTNAFHNGYETFYNRNNFELTLGFDNYYATESLVDKGLTDYQFENNLDSELIEAAKDEMFPTDRRFYSYIITISQHGHYLQRKNLEPYYDLLAEFGLKENGNELHDYFVTYVASALELDKAIGVINRELEIRGLKDNTIVTLFSDHNAYYNNLSNYVKGIQSFVNTNDKNYLDLYRVPLIMYIPDKEPEVNDKFMVTADILPTILDVLGINFFGNIYFGNSAFSEEKSILYSRAYDFFATEDLYYMSLNRVKFSYNNAVVDEDVERRTVKLVEKMVYNDRVFYNDFYNLPLSFADKAKYQTLSTYGDLYQYYLKQIQNIQVIK